MKILAEQIRENEGNGRSLEVNLGPGELLYKGGTWTDDVTTNVPAKSHAAAAEATIIVVPISLPAHATTGGSKVSTIDLYYTLATADAASAAAPAVYKVTAADGTAAAAVAAGGTITYSLTTTAMTATTGAQRKLTITCGTPAYIRTGEFWSAQVAITCAATTVLKVQGATVKFTRAL